MTKRAVTLLVLVASRTRGQPAARATALMGSRAAPTASARTEAMRQMRWSSASRASTSGMRWSTAWQRPAPRSRSNAQTPTPPQARSRTQAPDQPTSSPTPSSSVDLGPAQGRDDGRRCCRSRLRRWIEAAGDRLGEAIGFVLGSLRSCVPHVALMTSGCSKRHLLPHGGWRWTTVARRGGAGHNAPPRRAFVLATSGRAL